MNLQQQGVKFAIAGGNSNADVDYTSPAAAGAVENVYTVSAVDKKYVMASFTNYDDDDDGGENDDVDVAGPGVDVLSYTGDDGTIQAWSGTSMAAPAVAGLLLMTPQDGEGPKKTVNGAQVSDAADGIQDGEDVFPNYTTFTDPYALSTLYGGIEPYQDGFNDDDQPDDAPEGDDDWEKVMTLITMITTTIVLGMATILITIILKQLEISRTARYLLNEYRP